MEDKKKWTITYKNEDNEILFNGSCYFLKEIVEPLKKVAPFITYRRILHIIERPNDKLNKCITIEKHYERVPVKPKKIKKVIINAD